MLTIKPKCVKIKLILKYTEASEDELSKVHTVVKAEQHQTIKSLG